MESSNFQVKRCCRITEDLRYVSYAKTLITGKNGTHPDSVAFCTKCGKIWAYCESPGDMGREWLEVQIDSCHYVRGQSACAEIVVEDKPRNRTMNQIGKDSSGNVGGNKLNSYREQNLDSKQNFAIEMLLITSELSCCLSDFADNNIKYFSRGIADVLIRILRVCSENGIDIDSEVESRMSSGHNSRHGGGQ